MSIPEERSLESILVVMELSRLGLPVPPPATLALLVAKATERYADWYYDQLIDEDPDTEVGMFVDWKYIAQTADKVLADHANEVGK